MGKNLFKLNLRKCYFCKKIMPLNGDNFYKNKNKPGGLDMICKPCKTIERRNYYKTEGGKISLLKQRENKKKNRKRYYNPIKAKENWKKTYEKHKERMKYDLLYAQKYKESRKLLYKKRIEKHPEITRALINKRRRKLRFEMFKKYNFTCQYCGRKAPNVVLQIEHIIPKNKGGKTIPENLTIACFDCNIGKLDTLLTEVQI